MEFAIVVLIVVVAGAFLGGKAYRFFRRATAAVEPGAPACSGCSACTPEKPDEACPVATSIEFRREAR